MRVQRITWLLVAACFFSSCAFVGRPTGRAQLAFTISALVAIVYVAMILHRGVINWREHGLNSLLACLLIFVSFWGASFAGHAIRRAIFTRDLDRYNQAVAWVRSHASPNQPPLIQLPEQYAELAYVVIYEQDKTCGLRIDFLWGVGFPVKHVVRRFSDNPHWVDIKQCHRASWERYRVIASNWYEIAD